MSKNAKKQSQQVSEQEKRQPVSVGAGSAGTGQNSSEVHGQSIGIDGANSARGSEYRFPLGLGGGILVQLIKQAEHQLEEAEACIDWYQNQREKVLEYLDELRRLQSLEPDQGVQSIEPSESEQ